MGDIMLTSGSNFEGYDIVEYLGFVNGQIALSSNFFKDLSSNLADFTAQESTAFTNKLENASENAIENLIKVAEKKGANALVGVELNYTNFSGGSVGTVASGTAVVIKKKAPIHKVITSKIYVSNYYNLLMPRPVEITLAGEDNVVKISPVFYNYNQDEIKTVRCDIELTNFYGERMLIQGIDFVFEKNNVTKLKADFVECKLAMKDIPLIKDVKVYVKKYVTEKGVFAPDAEPIDITMSKRSLDSLKEKRGRDAVERYKSDGTTWICNCGYINAAGDEECAICGRKEDDLKTNIGFNYEEMTNRMKGLPNVSAMKDILMEYIKKGAIDAKYRMELLEIMESGLQYEKTRGDMTETVLDKVLKVFEN
jgi:uncharacterized protein YbjQ (UPF0145 family)